VTEGEGLGVSEAVAVCRRWARGYSGRILQVEVSWTLAGWTL
jgi:hypothetical protein